MRISDWSSDVSSSDLAYAEAAQSGDAAKQKDVGAALQAMAGPDTRIDFACTGFAVPAGLGKDGRHLHARNLDADLYNWNTAPVLSLLDETADHPGWHKYAAFQSGERRGGKEWARTCRNRGSGCP